MRRAQVALYLLMALVAITFLVLMNVGAYLGVTAKNRAMNAGDAAALAVARHQAHLLSSIADLTVERLRSDDAEESAELAERQARLCFLGPLEGIRKGNEAARSAGIDLADEEGEAILREHVIDIRTGYQMDVEQYPEPWPGAWQEYAQELELQLAEPLYASPDGIDFIDAEGGHGIWHKYLDRQFYNAVAGRNWCWFHFNAPGLIDSYNNFRDWAAMPVAGERTRLRRSANSEIHSLHLEARRGSVLELLAQSLMSGSEIDDAGQACRIATNIVAGLSGKSVDEIARSFVLTNRLETWYFYGEKWRSWWEMDPGGRWNFPVVGKVKEEYDVRGAAAICRVVREMPRLLAEGGSGRVSWTAAAKPFAAMENVDGELDKVTAFGSLVAGRVDGGELFEAANVRLVAWDAVGGRDDDRPNLEMVPHVRRHLPVYLELGSGSCPADCYFCDQLRAWERESLRSEAQRWLKFNSSSCIRSTSPGYESGGTPHGH
jgi:hypothetical protein